MVGVMFLALGWNFIDLGLDPPRQDGTDIGWLVSGVVFWLMAVGFLAPAAMRAVDWVRRGGEPEEPMFRESTVRAVLGGGAGAAPGATTASKGVVPAAVPPAGVPASDVPKRLVVPPRGPDEFGS